MNEMTDLTLLKQKIKAAIEGNVMAEVVYRDPSVGEELIVTGIDEAVDALLADMEALKGEASRSQPSGGAAAQRSTGLDAEPSAAEQALLHRIGERIADEVEKVAHGRMTNCEQAARDVLTMTAASEMYRALKGAEGFIRNGVELGFIRMPDAATPDPAHETLPAIQTAIAKAEKRL
jgi:hypothetical protein